MRSGAGCCTKRSWASCPWRAAGPATRIAVNVSALQLRNRGIVEEIMQAIGVVPQVAARLAMVSTIINLAHSLKLKVVADGVETDEQSRQLFSLNCYEMQGFMFSKPVPAEIFEARFPAPLTPGDKQ
jgi:EAL domain-containing protein (putative c-di-GMP-specific phosphodiesterase class I)